MRRPKLLRLCAPGLVAAAGWLGAACGPIWAADQPASPERLLPLTEQVPGGLLAENLESLGPKWQAWSEQTADLIEQLFERSPDDASQRTTLAALRVKLHTINTALEDPRYAQIQAQLADLKGKLSRRLDVYDGLRALLESPIEPSADGGAGALHELGAAVSDLESSLIVMPNGASWLPFVHAEELEEVAGRPNLTDADRKLLTAVLALLNDTSSLAAEQQTFLKQPMFRRLASAIEQALMTGPGAAPADLQARVKSLAGELLSALEEYEATGSRSAASRVRAAQQELQRLGGKHAQALTEALRIHYFNFNIHLLATETFMRKFFSDERSESGGVSEYVKDVYVSGCQWTNTKVGVDLKPSDNGAKFVLTLDGDVRSQTTGEVSVATVYTNGTARFHAEKDVVFDGTTFLLCPSRIGVNASNCTYDAETCLEWMPVARNFARKIALQQAADRKPESDAYARNKISREVRTRFDQETGDQFRDAEKKLNDELYSAMNELQWRPELVSFTSTEEELIIRERLMRDGELAGGRPPLTVVPRTGLLVQLHQSLISNGADRMQFAGLRLTQAEVDQRIEERLDKLFKNRVKEHKRSTSDDKTRLIFDTVDPITLQFEDGAVIMSLRAGLERPGEEDIPTQIISVPLKPTIEGDQIVLIRGAVGVKPVERPRNIGEQITRANIMRAKIEQGIPERQSRDAKTELKQNNKVIPVQIRSITVEDGWLNLDLE